MSDSLLHRWSKQKTATESQDAVIEHDEVLKQDDDQVPDESDRETVAAEPGPADEEDKEPTPLPSIESLDEDSDYSMFMSSEVDEGLRKLALRKLFNSPVFNVVDGLNDYDEDFTTFEALGDIVTSDMKFHEERKKAEQAQAEQQSADLQGSADNEEVETEAHEAVTDQVEDTDDVEEQHQQSDEPQMHDESVSESDQSDPSLDEPTP